jgi:hypothetical protein
MKNTKGKTKTRDPEERNVTIGQGQAATGVMVPLPLMQGYGYPFESSEYPGMNVGVSLCSPVNLERPDVDLDCFRI